MNFTREPIIETVITPKEGCKLVIRNSKGAGQEDYFIDAVEVVSFGSSLFFRSLERPKSFLVPVSDYEVLEVRETRMVLKSVSLEKSVKIGTGKEFPPREKEGEEEKKVPSEEGPSQEPAFERRHKKRRSHHRREVEKPSTADQPEVPREASVEQVEGKGGEKDDEARVSSSIVPRKLIEPPKTLIKEKLSRYKNGELPQENLPSGGVTEPSQEQAPPPKEEPLSETPPQEPTELS